MKIMLPYYNDMTVFLSTIFRELEFKVDYMGRPTKGTIELATKYAPEAWCFDTKLMIGQLVEGARRGNDILAIPGAWGGKNENCLLGYLCHGVFQKRMEKIMGRKIRLWHFNVNPVEMIFSGYFSAYKNIAMLKPYTKINFFRTRVTRAFVLGVRKMRMVSILKEKILGSPEIIDKDRLFLIYDKFMHDMVYRADDFRNAKALFENAMKNILQLKRKKLGKKIRIGIVGDYDHTLFSLFPIFDIEKYLLSEDVFVRQPLSFINYYSFLSPIYSAKNRKEAAKIFPKSVTGSDAMTILSANYLKNKVDGLIHVGTFSCTPEEVANEVLISHKQMFPPILSLQYDAHTTEENMKVRIEAFIDMLRAK